MTTTVDPHRYVLRNYCRKECNALGDPDGGHMERHAGGPWMLAADVLPVLEELRRALTASEKLAAFGAAVLEESRQYLGDLDAAWLQDKATELGVLVEVKVSEPCAEDGCQCSEYGFPAECYRYAPEVVAYMGAMEKANG